jgi:glyoxylase-like metal-dependent hydrolase (beta-lactamase superfamily II)
MTDLRNADNGTDESVEVAGEIETAPPLIAGVPRALSPLVRRIVAPNPGKMTGPGTNTYLVGIDEIAVIDPGPDMAEHIEAIVGCGGDRIRWILCTHTHLDHSPGAAALKAATGAKVMAFGNRDGLKVDKRIGQGAQIEATEFRLTAQHTPGHASNHLCYLLEEERMLFSGDHVMQGSTVVIKPPDGDMAAYLDSLAKVRALRLRSIAPGHGQLIEDPDQVIDWYIAHRLEREADVIAALGAAGSAKISALVETIYVGLDPELVPMAQRSVHAHLLKLAAEGRATGRTLTGTWTSA